MAGKLITYEYIGIAFMKLFNEVIICDTLYIHNYLEKYLQNKNSVNV